MTAEVYGLVWEITPDILANGNLRPSDYDTWAVGLWRSQVMAKGYTEVEDADVKIEWVPYYVQPDPMYDLPGGWVVKIAITGRVTA